MSHDHADPIAASLRTDGQREPEVEERLAEVDRISAKYAGLFTESLESIREGWPE